MKKYKDRQYAVLGLGIFGSTVAKTLSKFNCEVIAVDTDIKCVDRMADIVTQAIQCDITDINQLRAAGIQDCDIAIVSMGSHLEESVMAIINLKELGVPYIVAKAKNKRYMQIFKELGANKVVRPEKEMGEKVARTLLRKNIKDLIELDEENCIVEMKVPQAWVGKTLSQLDLRKLYSINVLGKRNPHTHKLEVPVDPNLEIELNDTFLVLAQTDKIEKYDYLL